MAAYSIFFRETVHKDPRAIPKGDLARILERISALSQDPRPAGSEKLTGDERYRVRRGDYRIVYSVHDDRLEVWVVKVGHRKDVYRPGSYTGRL
jgi:mRNA interferase RelE/StbE